ncbi:hypothetical protein CBS147320_10459 [Aspergillus niger]|nr:hypothetical protein CBS147320_10459 [Aspergillus niger]
MGKHQRSSSCRKGKKKVSQQSLISDSIQRTPVSSSSPNKFTKAQLEEQLLKTITCLRLPFQIVEDNEFQRLLNLVRSGPQGVELPSAKTLRRRLREAVVTQQEMQLRDLPEDAKVSLALDCWTSPFQQAFMAITVYFIDKEWNYRELLLGFEPLHGPHSGVNLSDVLLQSLRERHLLSRIFSVTTDNATNNETLVRALQETLLSTGAIRSRDSIIRVPCMAHVIQLCLKRLLGHIKAAPQNKEVANVWSDSQMSYLRSSADHEGVASTLGKIRSFATFVNASPQRRDAFLCLQSGRTRLFPIHDVQTRWNSTFLMLRRARKLRNCIDKYCNDHDYSQFSITDDGWRQIDYFLQLTKPFFQFTMALMKTKDVTIHSVFLVYRKLLEHIERSNQRLSNKTTPWKRAMYNALLAAKQKLKEYYEKTYRDHGFLYGTGTLLAPQYKLCAFDDTEYSKCQSETSKRYCDYLRNCFAQYKRETPEMSFRTMHSSCPQQASELDRLLTPLSTSQLSARSEYDEVDRYLREGTVQLPPRAYWKEHEHEYPVLSRLARDLLSVPATGAGVERLFNTARDICHYRRGSLNESTIQDLMMYKCSEIFNLDIETLSCLEKSSIEDVDQERLEEEEAIKTSEEEFDLISNDEEGAIEDDGRVLSAGDVTSRECMMSDVSPTHDIHEQDDEEDDGEKEQNEEEATDDELLPPPIQQLRDRSQKRSSGRVTVPSSRLQGYELY